MSPYLRRILDSARAVIPARPHPAPAAPSDRLAERLVVAIRPLLAEVPGERRVLAAPAMVEVLVDPETWDPRDPRLDTLDAAVTERLCARERHRRVLIPPPGDLVAIHLVPWAGCPPGGLVVRSAQLVELRRWFALVDPVTGERCRLSLAGAPVDLDRSLLGSLRPASTISRTPSGTLRPHRRDPDAVELWPASTQTVLVDGRVVRAPVVVRRDALIDVGAVRVRLDVEWTWGRERTVALS